MSSLRILIALWAAIALWKSAVTAIRTAGEQSELDAEAASLSESFQNGTDSENLAEVGVLVRVFFESWTYVHGQSQLQTLAEDGFTDMVQKARSWDDVVSAHKKIMSASLLNAGMMEDYGLDLWPHGVCGLLLNATHYGKRWRCFYPVDGCTEGRDGSGCGDRLVKSTSGGNCDRKTDEQQCKCRAYSAPGCSLTEWSAFTNWKCSGCPYNPAGAGQKSGGLAGGLKMQRAWKDTVRKCGSFSVADHYHGLTYNEVVLPYDPNSSHQVSAVFCRTVSVETAQYRQSLEAALKLRHLYEAKFGKAIPVLLADFAQASPFSPLDVPLA